MVRVASLLVAAFLVSESAFSQQTVVIQASPGAPAQPAPARDTTAKTGTARIRGHVVAAENGAPLRRAQVRATSSEFRENRVTATDEKGAFEFKDLPAGRYNISASKGSFVSLQYGQTRAFEGGKPLEVPDGQTVEKIDFVLPRGSVITGRVVDEYGEPAADVQVASMRSQFVQGRRRLVPTGRFASTNDIGEFRLFGLPPGQYYLSAMMRNFSFGDSDERTGYAQTYYPGTASPAEAQRIKVDLGQSVSDVNMTLITERTSRISGSVADSQGRPVAMGNVMAMPRGGSGMFFGPSANAQIKPDGTFTISGVAPGDYSLRANVGFSASGDVEFAVADVTASGDDISGVHLMTSKMVTATGRVVAQDAAAAQLLRLPIRLFTTAVNPDDSMMMMGGGGGVVKDDFTFELKVSPGKFRLTAQPAPGWALRAVRHNGIDVTDSGLEFTAGGDASGIEVELTNHPSDLSGLVTNSRGELARDYTVMVFSQDRDQWSGNSRYRGGGRPDQDGRFEIRALPAGKYYAIALDYVDSGEAGDPELLERIHTKATAFSINDGETKTLDLKLQTAS
ncbi:MAG TPA: carboxypeptidase-like regulatory domain-containing protein [Vicinamibacterales bacterium]|nr:carboxypeptidase-like regulatory domain-containing protein [Vicinamibacterales bacterium]